MPVYKNLDGDSGIVAYELGPDWIEIEFRRGSFRFYRYTYQSAGQNAVEEMKRLAGFGDGLNSYIKLHVKDGYASKR